MPESTGSRTVPITVVAVLVLGLMATSGVWLFQRRTGDAAVQQKRVEKATDPALRTADTLQAWANGDALSKTFTEGFDGTRRSLHAMSASADELSLSVDVRHADGTVTCLISTARPSSGKSEASVAHDWYQRTCEAATAERKRAEDKAATEPSESSEPSDPAAP